MNLDRVLLLSVVAACLAEPCLAALPLDRGQVYGTGSVKASALVSGITSVDSAIAESKSKRPSAKDKMDGAAPERDPASSPPPQAKLDDLGTLPPQQKSQGALPSRLEVVAGADHLLATTDVFKQASLSAEARYRLSDTLQLGLSAGVRTQGDGVSKDSAAQVLFGPIFNFGASDGLVNAFFLSPKFGVTLERVTQNDSVLRSGAAATLSLSLGKRFALSDSIAWAPSIDVIKQAGYSPVFAVVPISLAIFF